jgi:hypothetical protein
MPRVNLTNKHYIDQVRIVKDYLIRRYQHDKQPEIAISQLMKRFKHRKYKSENAKSAFLTRLLEKARMALEQDRRQPVN